MTLQRIFLGTGRHCLHGVVDQLAAGWPASGEGQDGVWDLRSMIVVLPGGLAVRRLERLLLDRAKHEQWRLVPPEVMTIGHLPERLIIPPCTRADDLTVALTCRSVLSEMDGPAVSLIAGGRGTETLPFDTVHLHALGTRIGTLLSDLASSLHRADDVATHELISLSPEAARWGAIAELQDRVDDRLAQYGYRDAHAIAMDAARGELPLLTEGINDIVLVSADYSAAMAGLLDRIADADVTVTAMVHHDDESLFDRRGRIDIDVWTSRPPALGDAEIFFADGPTDQAARVVDVIRRFDETLAADEITVGTPDDDVAVVVERGMAAVGLPVRRQGGRPMKRGCVLTLLESLGELLLWNRYTDLAALIRHADVNAWLSQEQSSSVDIVSVVDRWHRDRLPATISWKWDPGDEVLMSALLPLKTHLDALSVPSGPVGAAARPILDFLRGVYSRSITSGDGDHLQDAAEMIEMIASTIHSLAVLPEAIVGAMTPGELISLLVESLAHTQRRQPPWDGEIELLGWLECHLDDAPALIVTGCNHSSLPGRSTQDGFLPESVRRALGMTSLHRRSARDAFLLEATCHSGRDVTLIAGRRTASGDPLVPSALILGSGDARVRMVQRFTDSETNDPPPSIESLLDTSGATQRFSPCPTPAATGPWQRMSVTSFRTYLEDPYVFLLKYAPLLRLRNMDDDEIELDNGQLGTFAHKVLEAFGREEREAVVGGGEGFRSPKEIRAALHRHLDAQIADTFDSSVESAVRVQLELLRRRLSLFADHQAQWKEQGWEVSHVEAEFSAAPDSTWSPVEFPVGDGRTVLLTGTIDRIDRHRETGRYVALDYKTGSEGQDPAKAHRGRAGLWRDLQLPLYRHMLESVGVIVDADHLGYINIPRARNAGFHLTNKWTGHDVSEAIIEARRVAALVLDGCFESSGRSGRGRRDPFHRVTGELMRTMPAGGTP